jgi:hypothetical protein
MDAANSEPSSGRRSGGLQLSRNPPSVVVSKRGSQITPVLVDGFEVGYVWDTKSTSSTASPNTRRALKDSYYATGRTAPSTSC